MRAMVYSAECQVESRKPSTPSMPPTTMSVYRSCSGYRPPRIINLTVSIGSGSLIQPQVKSAAWSCVVIYKFGWPSKNNTIQYLRTSGCTQSTKYLFFRGSSLRGAPHATTPENWFPSAEKSNCIPMNIPMAQAHKNVILRTRTALWRVQFEEPRERWRKSAAFIVERISNSTILSASKKNP